MTTESKNKLELKSYRDIIESFFDKQYPGLEKDKFWKWFLVLLTGKDLDINTLSPLDISELLTKLNELGTSLTDPKLYLAFNKG